MKNLPMYTRLHQKLSKQHLELLTWLSKDNYVDICMHLGKNLGRIIIKSCGKSLYSTELLELLNNLGLIKGSFHHINGTRFERIKSTKIGLLTVHYSRSQDAK
jgi:hypothetical protein